jgi:hypothetical protein
LIRKIMKTPIPWSKLPVRSSWSITYNLIPLWYIFNYIYIYWNINHLFSSIIWHINWNINHLFSSMIFPAISTSINRSFALGISRGYPQCLGPQVMMIIPGWSSPLKNINNRDQ